MQRISKVEHANAPEKTRALLDQVKSQMGGVPALIQTLAQSPAALAGYLGLSGSLSQGVLEPKLREQVALAVAGANACDYCASAHTALGRKQGVDKADLARNLQGQSEDAKTNSALQFVTRVVETRGQVSDQDVDSVRQAGYSQEEIVELVAHTALNIFTNYFNHVAATEIDFPLVQTRPAKVAN